MSRINAHPRGIKGEVIFQVVVLGQGAQTHFDALHKVCCTAPSKMSLRSGLGTAACILLCNVLPITLHILALLCCGDCPVTMIHLLQLQRAQEMAQGP